MWMRFAQSSPVQTDDVQAGLWQYSQSCIDGLPRGYQRIGSPQPPQRSVGWNSGVNTSVRCCATAFTIRKVKLYETAQAIICLVPSKSEFDQTSAMMGYCTIWTWRLCMHSSQAVWKSACCDRPSHHQQKHVRCAPHIDKHGIAGKTLELRVGAEWGLLCCADLLPPPHLDDCLVRCPCNMASFRWRLMMELLHRTTNTLLFVWTGMERLARNNFVTQIQIASRPSELVYTYARIQASVFLRSLCQVHVYNFPALHTGMVLYKVALTCLSSITLVEPNGDANH
eukprot:6188271-Pleurochrysis_carterae.AAC.1